MSALLSYVAIDIARDNTEEEVTRRLRHVSDIVTIRDVILITRAMRIEMLLASVAPSSPFTRGAILRVRRRYAGYFITPIAITYHFVTTHEFTALVTILFVVTTDY